MSAAPKAPAADVGFITPGFEQGALFLKNTAGSFYRLEWSAQAASGEAADRRRAVPAGEYTLTGYRVIRRDKAGTIWFISATGTNLRRVTVRPGVEQQAPVDDAIRITGGAHPERGGVAIHVMLAGIKGSGLSIYRDGRRIDIGYRLADAKQRELARGALAYG